MRTVPPESAREKRRTRRSTVIASVMVAALTIGGAAGVAAGETIRTNQVADASAELAAAQSRFERRLSEQQTTVATVMDQIGAAQGDLDRTGDRVLDNAVRQQLADALATVTRGKVQTVRAMARAQKAVALAPTPPAVAADLVAAAEMRDALSVTADMSPLTLLPTLDDASEAVIAAEAQWLAEQERLAAEAARLAAEAAARAEAERVAQAAQAAAGAAARKAAEAPTVRSAPPAAARNPESAPPAAPSESAPFDEYVWAAGGQGELDACKGSVDLTGIYGFPVIGEHWSCGGSRFPTAEGTTIRLSGVLEGLYRVGPIVAILNQKTNKTWDAPSNHDLLYQTCINGLNTQMSYAALTRIG